MLHLLQSLQSALWRILTKVSIKSCLLPFFLRTNQHDVEFCLISCLLAFDGWDDCIVMDSTFTKWSSSYYFQFNLLAASSAYTQSLYCTTPPSTGCMRSCNRLHGNAAECLPTLPTATLLWWRKVQHSGHYFATSFYSVCSPSAVWTFVGGKKAKRSSNT